MKASVKLREGESPLVRAKLPMNLLGMPVNYGISMGSARELAFQMSSMFDAGPCCRVIVRPNNADNPLALMIKAGLGLWGSPKDAPLTVSAEMKFSTQGSPSFALHLKPRVGSFSLRSNNVFSSSPAMASREAKSQGGEDELPSTPVKSSLEMELEGFKCVESSPPSSEGSSVVMVESEDCDEHQEKHQHCEDCDQPMSIKKNISKALPAVVSSSITPNFVSAGEPNALHKLGDWSLVAHTLLPLGKQAAASVRWRVKVPADILAGFQSQSELFTVKKLPVLVVDKLSLECGEVLNRNVIRPGLDDRVKLEIDNPELEKVSSMCSAMKHQLRLLYFENRVLKKAMEEMKTELNGGKRSSSFSSNRGKNTYMISNEGEIQKQLLSQFGSEINKKNEPAAAAAEGSQNHQSFVIKGLES